MTLNVFSGARRLAVAAGVLLVGYGAYRAESGTPYLSRTQWLDSADDATCYKTAEASRVLTTPKGNTASLTVYYRSCNSFNQIVAESSLRKLADTVNLAALDQQASDQRWDSRKWVAQRLLVALAALLAATFCIGWVTRGFLGVPRGMDRAPDKP